MKEEHNLYDNFIDEVRLYYPLSSEAVEEFIKILQIKHIKKGEYLLKQGSVPTSYGFIQEGLFSYFHTYDNGDEIIKKFFAEKSFIASTAALIEQKPSLFAIQALEDSKIFVYPKKAYKDLMRLYPEISFFHINYLEKNWVVDKEPLEVDLKYKTAKIRYQKFLNENKHLQNRLKQHQISSYLGITPTQLSRIRRDLLQ
ncbi:Crp/Fnr family transcriptional regulator [Sphingobacterium alkalisoli]|uniref:Crp/Fnr family transcriptional regulator n=1 Tax=Sphingobacterium alkalisoli TaxID=1874115 RepID=A0A4V5LYH1_9SPHI|nr:Crp/Fnr family transcriptional regulator [Sphingobacterium alkalisoli]TJY65999.1 Crp/Fnr family transcriptional regulator [Sphingobacterium alkalisoli]GGH16925.1 cAMP-binding protein [Sphingobacterium alkalisoli]